MRIFDISWLIHKGMAVYPSNPKPKITQVVRIPNASSNNSLICIGSHTGTHVDSKLHIANKGLGVDKLPLDSLCGTCRVLDCTKCKEGITAGDLKKFKPKKGEIILLKTRNSLNDMNKKRFNERFIYITIDASAYLAKKKIKTVGIDYLSVQKFHSGQSIVHKNLIDNMTVFEGLNLKGIKPGKYFFCGLPLKIKGIDGAPARAILIKK